MALLELSATGIAPLDPMHIAFAPRINLIIGDNGLGKSLVLDLAFYQLTNSWPEKMIRPRREAMVQSRVVGEKDEYSRSARFDPESQRWIWAVARPPMTALVVYARAGGGFSVWDPARNYYRTSVEEGLEGKESPRAFLMSQRDVWEGLVGSDGTIFCNGLIRDWVSWQRENKGEFTLLQAVLRRLSPGPDELLSAGEPIALDPNDDRDFPTLNTPYGVVAAHQASEAVRRIVALAYLLVWTWTRHERAAAVRQWDPFNRLVILVDELEAHLHPKWQRTILPALQEVVSELRADASVQLIGVTHSPLLLASMEPTYDMERDRLFTVELVPDEARAEISAMPFVKRGGADAWLKSDVFDLASTLSIEAANAVERAERWMDSPDHNQVERMAIEEELRRYLAEQNDFWIQWRHEVKLSNEASP